MDFLIDIYNNLTLPQASFIIFLLSGISWVVKRWFFPEPIPTYLENKTSRQHEKAIRKKAIEIEFGITIALLNRDQFAEEIQEKMESGASFAVFRRSHCADRPTTLRERAIIELNSSQSNVAPLEQPLPVDEYKLYPSCNLAQMRASDLVADASGDCDRWRVWYAAAKSSQEFFRARKIIEDSLSQLASNKVAFILVYDPSSQWLGKLRLWLSDFNAVLRSIDKLQLVFYDDLDRWPGKIPNQCSHTYQTIRENINNYCDWLELGVRFEKQVVKLSADGSGKRLNHLYLALLSNL